VKTHDGELIGKLGAKTAPTTVTVSGTVSGVMLRTLEQTPSEYRDAMKTDRWETVLIGLIVNGADGV
jgi:hypothetical protein